MIRARDVVVPQLKAHKAVTIQNPDKMQAVSWQVPAMTRLECLL